MSLARFSRVGWLVAVSWLVGVSQFVLLAADFNQHRVGSDFNTANMNPASDGYDIPFIAGGKGVVVDDGQPVIGRSGEAFQNHGGYFHRAVGGCGRFSRFVRTVGIREKWVTAFPRVCWKKEDRPM